MSINPLAFKRLTTARLLIRPLGAAQFLDLGDVTDHEYNPDPQRLDIESPGNGYQNINAQLLKSLKQMMSVTLNETTPGLIELNYMAKARTAANQVAGTALTATFTSVKLRDAYILGGNRNVTITAIVNTSQANNPLFEGVDYYLDPGIGYISLIPGGSVVEGNNIAVTYNCPAMNRWSVKPGTLITTQGDVQFYKKDQFADDPVDEISFFGQYFISQRSGGSKELATYKLDLFPQRNFNVKYRDIII